MKKNVATTRAIAIAEKTRSSGVVCEVFASELLGWNGLDEGAVALSDVPEGSAGGTLVACGGLEACGSGGVAVSLCGDAVTVRTLTGGTVGGGTLLGGRFAAGTFLGGISVDEG